MLRKNFYLSEKQVVGLENAAANDGISVSEILRRAIDRYLEDNYRSEVCGKSRPDHYKNVMCGGTKS